MNFRTQLIPSAERLVRQLSWSSYPREWVNNKSRIESIIITFPQILKENWWHPIHIYFVCDRTNRNFACQALIPSSKPAFLAIFIAMDESIAKCSNLELQDILEYHKAIFPRLYYQQHQLQIQLIHQSTAFLEFWTYRPLNNLDIADNLNNSKDEKYKKYQEVIHWIHGIIFYVIEEDVEPTFEITKESALVIIKVGISAFCAIGRSTSLVGSVDLEQPKISY